MKNIIVGWREYLSLPSLGITHIAAKVDTGAKTSALHTFFINPFTQNNEQWVEFGVHPIQDDATQEVICKAPVIDIRHIKNSGGIEEERFVISATMQLGTLNRDIEMTLTNRDNMKFRMLLGREAMRGDILVNPAKSFLIST